MIVGYVGRVFLYDSIVWVIIGSTVVSIGTAIAYAAMPTLIMAAVPITETASAERAEQPSARHRHVNLQRGRRRRPDLRDHDVGPVKLPSFDAFQDVFWMAALASAASILAAVFIPRAAGRRRPAVARRRRHRTGGPGPRPGSGPPPPDVPPS